MLPRLKETRFGEGPRALVTISVLCGGILTLIFQTSWQGLITNSLSPADIPVPFKAEEVPAALVLPALEGWGLALTFPHCKALILSSFSPP
jgi:hypothetical protein